MSIENVGDVESFAYTGGIQTFVVPYTGLYKLDVYGGGTYQMYYYYDSSYKVTKGKGGHACGYKVLTKGTTIYVVCGGRGGNSGGYNESGGYNGGGKGFWKIVSSYNYTYGQSGGGATHMAFVTGTLSSIGYDSFVTQGNGLIVAGGAGGGYYDYYQGMYAKAVNGGGARGVKGWTVSNSTGVQTIPGGSQTKGYAFGQGGTGNGSSTSDNYVSGGGGGGFYGGYGGVYSGRNGGTGSGGSGWVGGVPEITYRGVTYSPSNIASGGTESAHGSATIELIEKGGFPPITFNGVTLDGITFINAGTTSEISSVIFNGTEIG